MNSPRPATHSDLPQISDLLDTIFRREKGVEDQSVLTDFPLVFDDDNLSNCRVIERDGRIVSHAAVWPRTFRFSGESISVGIIVLVATDSRYRRQGLAAELMRDLQMAMPGLGCQLGLLWTGVPDFYESLGWSTVQAPGWIVREATSSQDRQGQLRVVDYETNRHLDALHHLHRDQPIHSQRTRAESAKLFTLPKCPVLVGEVDGHPVAYLVEGRATNKRGLVEYAGDPGDVWELICHVTAARGPQQLLIFPTHPELAELARAAGWTIAPLVSSKGFGDEMVLLLDQTIAETGIVEQLFCWGLDQA